MKFCMKVFLPVQCVLFCLLILGHTASAQNTMLSQTQETRRQMFLSLNEAINLVLQNNLEIRIEQYKPEIKKEDIKNAEAAFDSTVKSGGTQIVRESESVQTPTSTTGIESGIEKRFRTGGSYALALKSSRSAFDQIDDVYSTGLELTLNHALLKNQGVDVNTTAIRIAQKNRESSVSELRSKVIDVVSNLKNMYWNLVYALGDLEAKRLSLQDAPNV